MRRNNKKIIIIAAIICAVCAIAYYSPRIFYKSVYYKLGDKAAVLDAPESVKPKDVSVPAAALSPQTPIPVTHIATPAHVRAVYASGWVAGSPKYFDPLVKLVDMTEINAMVIDVKDSTGRISFHVSDPDLEKIGSVEGRIPDIRTLTNMLHAKHIYIIGRVAVFQDPFMTKLKPEWSITKKSDGKVWTDNKGLSFLDPANENVWKYTVAIARDAYNEGFDEINFDYVRYPSDGNIKDINYHLVPGKTRADNLEAFFKYLSTELKKDPKITMSADLFGLTTETNDDMGIGQVWEKAMPYFDYIAPMIYPSHYPPGQDGFKNPAEHPYEIISKALAGAIKKTNAMSLNSATGATTTDTTESIKKIRPWLQDFNLGAVYTADMVKAQIKAVYDKGLDSWMLWDPKNKYTPGALELDSGQ